MSAPRFVVTPMIFSGTYVVVDRERKVPLTTRFPLSDYIPRSPYSLGEAWSVACWLNESHKDGRLK